MKEVKFAILGYGGIAKAHKKGYDRLIAEGFPIRLVAICDIDPSQFYKKSGINLDAELRSDLNGIGLYTDLEEMLRLEEIDVVDICLPSYLHKEYAIRMMRAGKHVQSEKPMGLTEADCLEMLEVAKETDRKLTIGQCLRFEPVYLYLKQCVEDGRFGALRRLVMDRLSAQPRWGFDNWYHDVNRSGGSPMDLHIHDVDMARFLLGEPKAISAITMDASMPMQSIHSRLFYESTTVLATASWDEAATVPFSMSYRARFEQATVLFQDGTITVFPDQGDAFRPEIPKKDRMAEEIRYMAMLVSDDSHYDENNDPASACKTVALVNKLVQSAKQNGAILQA